MKQLSKLLLLGATFFFLVSCGDTEADKAKQELTQFIENYESKMIPLQKEYNNANFQSAISGKEESYEKTSNLKITLSKILSNTDAFATLKRLKESNLISDTLLLRQLYVLYNLYLPHQIDEETQVKLIMLDNKIAKQFSEFRANIDGKEYTDNEIEQVLSNSTNNEELKKAWEASKIIGENVAKTIVLSVKKRNQLAKSLGYKDYYEMQLSVKGLNVVEIQNLFEELDILTRGPYSQLKAEMDEILATQYGIKTEELMPWHYQNRFFQQAPQIYDLKLDKFYTDADFLGKANSFYQGIGLPIEDVFENSDLFPKSGKSQLGYTVDIDKEGDVRILLNLDNNLYSMSSLLYEAGFAAYYKNIDRSLPYILRDAPQFFMIDAVATMMSSFASNPIWIRDIMKISEADFAQTKTIAGKHLRLEKFIFSRWAQVMFRFEKALYENPNQDLNKLWWDLVENYQLINRPPMRDKPDWASKTHIATQPCTYYNYMLGEIAAAQIEVYINSELLKSTDGCMVDCVNNPEVGKYLQEKIFSKGALYNWDDLIKQATGDELSADYFSKLYIRIN